MIPIPARIRASSAITTAASSNHHPVAVELLTLINSLSETILDSESPPSLGTIRLLCDDLRRIRQLLIEDGSPAEARDAFRRVAGFKVILEALRHLAGFFQSEKLTRDVKTEFFQLVKAVLDVLSEALNEHPSNRRYFALRVDNGGWRALEKALIDTGIGSQPGDEASEQLFGVLLAFGLAEESMSSAFRGIRRISQLLEALESTFVSIGQNGTAKDNRDDSIQSSATGTDSAETAIRNHIEAKFSGSETLRNPEIVPIILRFWMMTLERCQGEETPSLLSLAVPITLQQIQNISIRNQVAVHGSQALSRLLSVYSSEVKFPEIKNLLRSLSESVLKYGVNDLDDAYHLMHHAAKSKDVSSLLLNAMSASRMPPFIQFDLSIHGYSSIELPALSRSFPPISGSTGYTIMAWVRFDNFDSNVHTTIFGASDSTESCFLLLFLEKDEKHLVLQTSVKAAPRASVRFRSTKFRADEWYHIAVVHKKPKTTTSSRAALFVNGVFSEQIKCQYPAHPPPLNSSTESFASMTGTFQQYPPVQTFLGNPRGLALREGRNMVHIKWSLASFHLFSEAVGDDLIQVYEKLGPRYMGNFQDCLGSFQTYRASAEVHLQNELLHPGQAEKSELMTALRQYASTLLPEPKILISFSPNAVLDNEDRNHVNETRLIKSLSREASNNLQQLIRVTGKSIIVNSAAASYNEALTHAHGIAILTGDPVVSVPQSLDDTCWRIGGSAPVVLKLLDLARTKDEVLRAVQIVFDSLSGSWRNSEAMERENGYGVMAGLMREKLGFGSIFGESISSRPYAAPVDVRQREELALELLRLTLSFVGYSEVNPEDALLINGLAYRFLLVDFDTWRRAPIATQKLYYSQFVHYAAKGRHHKFNSKRLIRMRIVKRLLDALKGESFSADVFPDFLEAFSAVFKCSISPETLRSLALFVTFALQDSRAFPNRSSKVSLISRQAPKDLNGQGAVYTSRERSSSRPSPFNVPISPSSEVSRFEIGVQMLEVFTEVLCEPGTDIVYKFATTVTNKWLLFLLAERDPRIVVLATKVLARLLIVHGPNYVKDFSIRTGGFVIMKQRLKTWWSVPALWTTLLAILFGVDIAKIDYSEDFNQFALAEIFHSTSGRMVYPDVLPVLTAMLENGLRSIVRDGKFPSASGETTPSRPSGGREVSDANVGWHSDSLNVQVVKGSSAHEVTNNAEILNTVIRFLGDLHLKWSQFREYSATSQFVQELLFVLYPVIVTSDNVSAETELNSRGSALTFEGQDVVIRPHITSENHRPPIVRTATVPSSSPSLQRVTPFRRASSFILVTSETSDTVPSPAKFNAIMSPTSSGPVALRVGSNIVQGLLGVITGVYLDQILHRKDFQGFGLFLKVPPGFQEHQAYFESYVLSHALSELSNTLRMQEQLLREPRVITNVSKYTLYMSEAIFEGWYLNGAVPLLDFVGQTLEYLQRPEIASLKNVRLCNQAISSMKRVFLRISLLRLSELDDVQDEKATVAFMEKLTYWQTVMLASDDEHYFLRLFFFMLYLKIISKVASVRAVAVDFWRLLLVQKPDEAAQVLNHAAPVNQRYLPGGFMKLAELDNEAFLVWIDHHQAELDSLFLGSLTKYWDDFVAEENRKTEETAQNRFAKRKDRLKTWKEDEILSENHWRKHETATTHWRNNVYSSERLKHQRAVQDQQDNLTFTAATLEKFDRILKGPCSLFEEDPAPKWRLDETEGQNRMRLRIIPDRSSRQDEYQPKNKNSDLRRTSSRVDSKVIHTASKEALAVTPIVQEPGNVLEPGRQRADSRVSLTGNQEDEYEIIDDPRTDEGEFEDKNRKVMRTLQRGDIVQHVCNVSRIEGLEALEGLLIIGKDCLYLIDHYFQRADGEVVGVWQAPTEERDPYLRVISGRETKMKKPRVSPGDRTTRHWRWLDVMLISKRRFLLRDVAIEVFFTDGRSYLLTAVSPEIRNDLFARLVTRAPLINNPAATLHPEDQWRLESLRNPEDVPQSLGSKFASVFNSAASNPATRRWMRGEISNFTYLMLVNTMAGRTFNDLTQYPVFPWVLADYNAEELDLTDPHTFRDLSKPMGCQFPSREAEFRDRYTSFSEMSDEPPYHYGTHYSSAMTVASYLIRLQPFVQSYLILQGGNFDHADRLFYSIERAWLSASRDNMTDVRELTPEFFYLPEFLVNLNGYNFGVRQGNGGKIDNVVLPRWAKGDPHIFIQKHREALESPYVSMHLHKWIDLIFGFKQQGEAAIEATNVFHYLSYQGAKDLDSIEDAHERLATIGIIHNFGQTPQQIFQRAHPQRDGGSSSRDGCLNAIIKDVSRSLTPLFDVRDRIATLTWLPKSERLLPSGVFQLPVPPVFDTVMRWGFSDGSVRFYTADNKKQLALYEHLHIGPPTTATFVDSRTLATAGADAVVTVWNVVHSAKNIEVSQRDSFFGHRAPVTMLVASKSLSTLISCDMKGRVLMWDLNLNVFVREIQAAGHGEVRAARISAATGDVVLCVGRVVKVFSLNGDTLLERDVCDDKDAGDYVSSCAWYEGLRGEWVEKILLFTGHRSGVTKIWYKSISPKTGKYTLTLVRRLNPPPPPQHSHALPHGLPPLPSAAAEQHGQRPAAVTCVLPMAHAVFVGDEMGRVFEWTARGHD